MNLNLFKIYSICLKFLYFEIYFLNYSNELDEEMTKTKVVDLGEIYNFVSKCI
jgi:hypothetical protein